MADDAGLLQPESPELNEDDVAALSALQQAKRAGMPEPGLSEQTALRLDALGYIRLKVVPGMATGGYEITAAGIARLAALSP